MLKKIGLALFSLLAIFSLKITHTIKLPNYSNCVMQFTQENPKPNVLIWDFGGVLMDFSYSGYMRHMGVSNVALYLILDWHNPFTLGIHLQEKMFAILNKVNLEKPVGFEHSDTHSGIFLPYVISAYQSCIISPEFALRISLEKLKEFDEAGYFISDREKIIIKRSMEAVFSPHIHAISTIGHTQGLAILKKVGQAQDCYGNSLVRQFVLSNWESTCYNTIKHKILGEHLNYIEDVLISGDIGEVKPNLKAFEILLDKHNIDRSRCVFIDDQKENIAAAKKAGIKYTILFTTYKRLHIELRRLGLV